MYVKGLKHPHVQVQRGACEFVHKEKWKLETFDSQCNLLWSHTFFHPCCAFCSLLCSVCLLFRTKCVLKRPSVLSQDYCEVSNIVGIIQ